MLKDKLNSFLKSLKSIFLKFWCWKPEEVWAWGLKALSAFMLYLLLLYIIEYALPYLSAIIILVLLCRLYQTASVPIAQQPSAYGDEAAARELLFQILCPIAGTLDLMSPSEIADIMPVSSPLIQSIEGLPFYHFIIRKEPGIKPDYDYIEEIINTAICQYLQEGYPNVAEPFYGDTPHYVVFCVKDDAYHAGYLSIDVMPVTSEKCRAFISKKQYRKHMKNMVSDYHAPDDEDF